MNDVAKTRCRKTRDGSVLGSGANSHGNVVVWKNLLYETANCLRQSNMLRSASDVAATGIGAVNNLESCRS